MTLLDEPDMPSEVRRDIAEHEVLLAFNMDAHAQEFREWWALEGWDTFKAWAESALNEGRE